MILRQYLRCSGSENRLVDCPQSSSTCSHFEDAGVTCLPTSELSITISDIVDSILAIMILHLQVKMVYTHSHTNSLFNKLGIETSQWSKCA